MATDITTGYISDNSKVAYLLASGETTTAGHPFFKGQIFGIAEAAGIEGATVQLARTGIWHTSLKTTGVAWTVGIPVYWKVSTSKYTTVATDGRLVGFVTQPAASGATTGYFMLADDSGTYEASANKATDFSVLNDVLFPTTDAVEDSFQPIWYLIATTASANTYTIALTGVVPTAYYTGMKIRTQFADTNTTTATINVNGLGVKTIVKNVSTALVANDLIVGKIYDLVYDGTNFQVQGAVGIDNRYALTTGIADVSVAVVSFPTAAYTTGLPFQVMFNITNATATPTLNVNGLGAKTIKKGVGGASNLSASDLVVTKIYTLIYDGTNLQINI